MSKEMEALEELKNFENMIGLRLDKVHKALTPPTEQEVCRALSEYIKEPIWLDNNGDIRISNQWVVKQIGEYGLNFMFVLPPRIITMIGKFYEGKSEKE